MEEIQALFPAPFGRPDGEAGVVAGANEVDQILPSAPELADVVAGAHPATGEDGEVMLELWPSLNGTTGADMLMEICKNYTESMIRSSIGAGGNQSLADSLGSELIGCQVASTAAGVSTTAIIISRPPKAAEAMDVKKIVFLAIIIVLTLLGNGSVVFSILVRRAKVTRMYFFILHLSVADILTAFLTLLPELFWTTTYPQFYGGNALCKLVKYIQAFAPYLSSYTLVMTAVDRYQVNPFIGVTSTKRGIFLRTFISIPSKRCLNLFVCVPKIVRR